MGALDFAGGTVVHINAAVAGLVGAYMIGKRIGYGREAFTPHSLTLTMVGAALLWVGWFGFNAGSALEAGNSAVLAFINTFSATAAAVLAWCIGEALMKGKASMLGAASGAVAGLVAITPACGNVGLIGAMVIGFVAGFACLWGVNGLKKMLGADDSLDVFGVHGVGGIVGALLTGVFNTQALGGPGLVDRLGHRRRSSSNADRAQVWIQLKAVLHHDRLVGRRLADRLQGRRPGDRPARQRGRRARRPRHRLPRRDGVPQLTRAGRRGDFEGHRARWPFFLAPRSVACVGAGRPICLESRSASPARAAGARSHGSPPHHRAHRPDQRARAAHARVAAGHRALVPARVDGAHAAVLHLGRPAQRRLQAGAGRHQPVPGRLQQPDAPRCCRWRCRRRWRRSRRSAPRRRTCC